MTDEQLLHPDAYRDASYELELENVSENIGEGTKEETTRVFVLGEPNKYPSNRVSHQKYNLFNVIPKFLYNQFRHFFNFFYLVITLTQLIPAFRIGFLITYVSPLLFVLAISFVKEMWDEYQRWKRDRELNNQIYMVHTKNGVKPTPSYKIRVGDIVEIPAGLRVPADLILLKTSEPYGTSFIKTAQLDGETDWKLRRSISLTQNSPELIFSPIKFELEPPGKDIYEFSGRLIQGSRSHSIYLENTIWCETVVTNGSVIGVVAYTGSHTRTGMNGTPAPVKQGTVDREINKYSSILFVLLFLAAFLTTALNGFHQNFHVLFVRFILLFSFIIPISMRVNLDLSKIVFSMKISNDKNIEGSIMRNSNIPEELGRIQILFTDKTGTLTKNEMEFKKMHIDNIVLTRNASKTLIEEQYMVYLSLALCHNVTVTDDGFRASSPDEIALVQYARESGFVLLDRTDDNILVRLPDGEEENFQLLAQLPFSSVWKHMSVVISSKKFGTMIISKGADTAIADMSLPSEWLDEVVGNLAREGLRTLVYAYRNISQSELDEFMMRYRNASISVIERSKNILSTFESINKRMNLLGVSGVEDKLQESVPETIEALGATKIKIWMLTGDKLETAMCVALSSRLFTRGEEFIVLRTFYDIISFIDRSQTKVPSLVIDGSAMEQALQMIPEVFINFTTLAPSVAICRCSPSQKELVVKVFMQHRNLVTCAVGDGGNDVSMIQAASIGIGIVGKEGKQASLSADCSINTFSHLRRLLLWHGTNSYKHSARLSQFVMHRGVIMTTTQAIYSLLFNLVPSPLYNDWLMMGFATVFTNFSVFSLIFDDFIDVNTVMAFPELYSKCQRGRYLSAKTFIGWTWLAIYQGSIIIFLSSAVFDIWGVDERRLQSVAFTSLILTELALVAMEINKFNIISICAEVVSILLYIPAFFLLPSAFDLRFVFSFEFFWKILIIAFTCIFPLSIYEFGKRYFTPSHEERLKMTAPVMDQESFFIL